ncbi:primosomal replication protein N [Pseudidiomarina salilacus]|uniref:primosomal replication protein N n=1 Tax=Pseudidiomarina salilacus TaxID=3384452 RepID=UPI003984731D
MELSNKFELGGVLLQPPKVTQSPAGIRHVRFMLEHRSQRFEAGLPRNAYVRIQVVISGELAQQWEPDLTVGMQLQVSGFLQRVEDRNGNPRLVLHAQQLVKI